MKRLWNFIYYCVYLLNSRISSTIGYPFEKLISLLYKRKRISKYFKGKGFSSREALLKEYQDARANREYGSDVLLSNVLIGLFLAVLSTTIFNVLIIGGLGIKPPADRNTLTILVLSLAAFVYLFNYFTLFKKDTYLSYFEEFDKIKRSKKIIYELLAFLFLLITPMLWWMSMSIFW